MSSKRITHAARLFSALTLCLEKTAIGMLITLLLLASAPSVQPLVALGMHPVFDGVWADQAPAASPSARRGPGMAWLDGDQVLLFGGWNGSYLGDTRIYDLSANTWTNPYPAANPSARDWHAIASIGEDQALLFGGGNNTGRLGDTWVYDLSENTWTNLIPPQLRLRGMGMPWLSWVGTRSYCLADLMAHLTARPGSMT